MLSRKCVDSVLYSTLRQRRFFHCMTDFLLV